MSTLSPGTLSLAVADSATMLRRNLLRFRVCHRFGGSEQRRHVG